MANITKIKAHDTREKSEKTKTEEKPVKKLVEKPAEQPAKEANKEKKSGKKPFFLFRPFIALAHYIRDSWKELRLVRWPSHKATWGMVLAVFIYTGIIVAIVMLLDMLFSYLSNLMLG